MSALPSIAPPPGRQTEADAAADLYARHSDRIFGYCLGLLRNREEAEDAVQTTFLNAYRGLRRGIQPEFEAAWLFKIAQNVCRTRRANAWRRGRVETARDLDALQDVVAAPEHVAGQAAELAKALEELPERYRTIILLREWQGLSYREIAAETDLSEGAVEMLVFRARRALAEKLQSSDDVRSRALGVSSILSMLKSLLGGAALKSAVTAIAITATAIAVATAPGDQGKATSPTKVAPGTAGHSTAPVAPQSAPDRVSVRGVPPVAAPPKSRTSDPVQAPPVPPASDVGGNADPPATPPPSAAPPAAARPPAPPPAAVATPSASVPAVTVPGIPISTPAVTVPSISLPDIPALDPPNLPGTLPDLHVP